MNHDNLLNSTVIICVIGWRATIYPSILPPGLELRNRPHDVHICHGTLGYESRFGIPDEEKTIRIRYGVTAHEFAPFRACVDWPDLAILEWLIVPALYGARIRVGGMGVGGTGNKRCRYFRRLILADSLGPVR